MFTVDLVARIRRAMADAQAAEAAEPAHVPAEGAGVRMVAVATTILPDEAGSDSSSLFSLNRPAGA
jgi:hypothetical protein